MPTVPTGPLDKLTPSPAAATPASCVNNTETPVKPCRTTSEHRKSSKPIMEKRRRARINESLAQLKTLILDALKKDSSRNSKLEKADILEMTVKHLRNMQRLQMTAAVTMDPSVLCKYRAGFSECVGEVTRFLSTCEGVNAEVRTRLLSHLSGRASQINTVNYTNQRQIPTYPLHPAALCQTTGQSTTGHVPNVTAQLSGIPCKGGSSPISIPPESFKLYSGLQFMPTDGHFAFLIPSAALAPLNAHSVHPPFAVAVSPGAPSVTADSVWRPW